MKSAFIFALALVLLMVVSAVPVSAVPQENEYGFANAWFNGQEATVKNIKLKIGEPADIKVSVTSNISGHVFVELSNPLVTEPYQIIEGTAIEQRIDNLGVSPGWSKIFTWKIKPNGAWTNGNAPINIAVQFYNTKYKESKIIEFTVANPYILDEQYEGTVPTPQKTTEAPETTSGAGEQPKADLAQQSNTASFPYLYLILIGAAIIIILVFFKFKK